MMKPTKQQLAIFGLYLSLSAALVSGGLYVVQRSFSLPLQISLALTIVGITAFVLLDPVRAQAALTGRQARYGSNALLKTLAFIGILIVLNYLAFQNSPPWDLTENREHTLTPETIDTLQSLSAPVTAKAFFTSRSDFSIDDTRKILESYQAAGKGNFNYQFIDPEADPVAAQKASISRDGTIVLEMEDRQEQVTFANEQEITSALIRLANPSERAVYFLTGRGEFDPKGSGEHSFSLVNQSLEQKNYVVKTLNLLTNPVIPDDALAIIIAGAQKAYSPNEISLIQEYVTNGGSLVVLAEPVMGDSIEDNFGLYEYLEQTWGIAPEDDVIIDPNVNPPLIAISDSYGSHPITERLMNRATIFPTVRSIRTTGERNLPRQELIFTSPMSWGETNLKSVSTNNVTLDQAADHLGPLAIAVAVTNPENQSRLVVLGDADFASDRYFQDYWNGDLIVNMIDWAARQDSLINLTPKTQTTRLLMPPTEIGMGLLLLGLVFVIPGTVILLGIISWVQRRKRG